MTNQQYVSLTRDPNLAGIWSSLTALQKFEDNDVLAAAAKAAKTLLPDKKSDRKLVVAGVNSHACCPTNCLVGCLTTEC